VRLSINDNSEISWNQPSKINTKWLQAICYCLRSIWLSHEPLKLMPEKKVDMMKLLEKKWNHSKSISPSERVASIKLYKYTYLSTSMQIVVEFQCFRWNPIDFCTQINILKGFFFVRWFKCRTTKIRSIFT